MGNTEDRAARIAVSPALFVLLVEGIVWGMSGTRDRMIWSVISVCLSALGLFFGFIFLVEALQVGCGGGCFGD